MSDNGEEKDSYLSPKEVEELISRHGQISFQEITIPTVNPPSDTHSAVQLCYLAEHGERELIHLHLSRHGDVDVNYRDLRGATHWYTPLVFALYNGHLDCARLLIEHGSEFNSSNIGNAISWTIRSPFVDNNMFLNKEREIIEFVRELITVHKVSVNIVTTQSLDTPLHYAAMRNSLGLVELLLDHKADPVMANIDKNRPADVASDKDVKEVLEQALTHELNLMNSSKQAQQDHYPHIMISMTPEAGILARDLAQQLIKRGLRIHLNSARDPKETVMTCRKCQVFIALVDRQWADQNESVFETNIAMRMNLVHSHPLCLGALIDSDHFDEIVIFNEREKYSSLFGMLCQTDNPIIYKNDDVNALADTLCDTIKNAGLLKDEMRLAQKIDSDSSDNSHRQTQSGAIDQRAQPANNVIEATNTDVDHPFMTEEEKDLLKAEHVDCTMNLHSHPESPMQWAQNLRYFSRNGLVDYLERHLRIRGDQDLEEKNKFNETALALAYKYGHTECIDLLVAAGAIDDSSKFGKFISETERKDLKRLTPSAMKLHCRPMNDTQWQENLRYFGRNGVFNHLQRHLALRGSLDLEGRNRFNETALLLACKYGKLDCAGALIRAGANVHHEGNGGNVLMWACRSYSEKHFLDIEDDLVGVVVYLLMFHNVDPNYQNSQGRTPLHYAAMRNSQVLCRVLLAAGAKPDIQCNDGSIPAQCTSNAVLKGVLSGEVSMDSDVALAKPDLVIGVHAKCLPYAEELAGHLREIGLKVWYCTTTTTELSESVIAISSARVYVPLIAFDFVTDERCYSEFLTALKKSINLYCPALVPVILNDNSWNAWQTIERDYRELYALLCSVNALVEKDEANSDIILQILESIKSFEHISSPVVPSLKEENSPLLPPACDVMISLQCSSMIENARVIEQYLTERNISVWMCMDQLVGGDKFRDEIVMAAFSSKIFLPLVNDRWLKSGECRYEGNIACKGLQATGSPLVVPVLIDRHNFTSIDTSSAAPLCTRVIFSEQTSCLEWLTVDSVTKAPADVMALCELIYQRVSSSLDVEACTVQTVEKLQKGQAGGESEEAQKVATVTSTSSSASSSSSCVLS